MACAFRFQDLLDNAHPNYIGDVGIGINPQAGRARETGRPGDCAGSAPRRDDHRRLYPVRVPGAAPAPGACACRRRRAGQRLPGRADDQQRHGAGLRHAGRDGAGRRRRLAAHAGRSEGRAGRLPAAPADFPGWPGAAGPVASHAGHHGAGAARHHHHEWRRQLCLMGAPLLPLWRHAHAAGADQWRHGLWRAGRDCRQDRAACSAP